MALTIPNDPAATYSDQAEPDAVDFDILVAAIGRSGVVSGCAVTQRAAGANMSVDVAAGTVIVAGATASVTAVNKTIGAADATNPRFDLITVNSSGTVAVTAGTASSNAVFPAIPATSVVLAAVYVPANATSVVTAQIVDKRVIVPLTSRSVSDTHTDSSVVNSTTETVVATKDVPTTVAQGDVIRFTAWGDALNTAGTATTYRLKLILGATTMIDSGTAGAPSLSSSATRRQWRVECEVLVVATNDQRASGVGYVNLATAGVNFSFATNNSSATGAGTATEDLTATKALQLSVTPSQANALTDWICHNATLEVVKR